VALLQQFGFCEADVIDKYLGANPRPDKIPDCASVLTAYRNATIHEGYLDFKKKHDAADVVRLCSQLKDTLTRVILKECGYTGHLHVRTALELRASASRLDSTNYSSVKHRFLNLDPGGMTAKKVWFAISPRPRAKAIPRRSTRELLCDHGT